MQAWSWASRSPGREKCILAAGAGSGARRARAGRGAPRCWGRGLRPGRAAEGEDEDEEDEDEEERRGAPGRSGAAAGGRCHRAGWAVGREPGPGEAAGAAPLLGGIYRRGGANGSRSKQPASHRPPARAGVCSEGRRRRRRRAGTLNSLARSQSYTSPAGCAPAICSRNAAGNVRPGRLPRRHRPPTGRGRPEGDGARGWAAAGPRWAEPSPDGPGRAGPY